MFKSLYQWTLSLAESPRATWALAAIAFAESSFFPIPPDVVLVPMALAKPQRALFYAGICTVASVFGGMLGYAIGALLFDTVGQWLISIYHLQDKATDLQAQFEKIGWAVILVKGLTPIPFKLVTIVCGLAKYNFPLFVGLSIVTRGARFFLIAGILNKFGEPIRAALERYFAIFLGIILIAVVGGFWLATRMF
jgi:membrane protein YqaA with SNARE-associated domain